MLEVYEGRKDKHFNKYSIVDNVVYVQLGIDAYNTLLIDKKDIDVLDDYVWGIYVQRGKAMVISRTNGNFIQLARLIYSRIEQITRKQVVKFRNDNYLDHRRENLYTISMSQSLVETRAVDHRNIFGIRGISKVGSGETLRARVQFKGKVYTKYFPLSQQDDAIKWLDIKKKKFSEGTL